MIFSLAQQFIVCSYIAILKSDLTAWNRKHLDANNITTMSNAQIIMIFTRSLDCKTVLLAIHICKEIVILLPFQPYVTFHAKTYTNGFVLNGQKPTAN